MMNMTTPVQVALISKFSIRATQYLRTGRGEQDAVNAGRKLLAAYGQDTSCDEAVLMKANKLVRSVNKQSPTAFDIVA